jgi:hypothetical protein
MSLAGGTGSRKITGQEIMNASKLSVNNTPVINGTAGRIFFQGSTNVLQQSGNLFWDDSLNRIYISAPFTGSITTRSLYWQQDSGLATIGSRSLLTFGFENPRTSGIGAITIANNGYEQGLTFHTASGGTGQVSSPSGSEAMRITNTKNLLIGTTTDAGFRLDVNGTARVVTSLQVGNFTVGVSNPSTINTNGIVRATGGFNTRNADGNDNVFTGITGTSALRIVSANSSILDFANVGGNLSANLINVVNGANAGAGTGIVNWFNNSGGIIPTASNTVQYNYFAVRPNINQGAFTGGVITGYLYDPILTSINSIHRAIHTVTGDVLLATTSGNVGIGTSSPVSKLHVSGSVSAATNLAQGVLFANTLTATANNDALIGLDINPTFTNGAFTGTANVSLRSQGWIWANTGIVFGTIAGTAWSAGAPLNGLQIYPGGVYYNGAGAGLFHVFRTNANNSGGNRLVIGDSTVQVLNTNLLVNTTTDAGFKLDVNGTARVQGALTVSSGGAAITGQLQANGGLKATVVLNNTFNTNGNSLTIFQSSDALGEARFYQSVCAGFVTTINSSAILQAESTTKGFLPPRMTQTQRNAIASPAIGLEIYQTDATEGKYIYKSSGWTYIG